MKHGKTKFYDLYVTNQDGVTSFLKRDEDKSEHYKARLRIASVGVKCHTVKETE